MISPGHKLSIVKQAAALEISGSSVYYTPPLSEAELWVMRKLDELHLEYL
jgi:putative transposase